MMDQNIRVGTSNSSPTSDGDHPLVDPLRFRNIFLGWASFGCALIFPLIFWSIVFAEANRILGKAIPGGRDAVVWFLVATSFSAVILGVLSLTGGIRKTAMIGMIVGLAELILIIVGVSNR
jgi:hypothetical protein